MKKFLIVVDMQNDFVTGSLGSKEAQDIVAKVEKKAREYMWNNSPIIFTKDQHDKNYLSTLEGKYLPVEHCVYGTDGYDLVKELNPISEFYNNSYIVTKPSFGYKWWNDMGLFNMYKEKQFELVGVCTDICVITNALLLRTYFPESKIIVDSSCCAGSTTEKHKAALEVMKSCHIDVV